GRVFLPCGEGVIDWSRLLTELHKANPDLPLSIECAGSSLVMPIDLDDPTWVALHPDLDPAEVAELRRLGADYAQQVTRGERLGLDDLTRRPYDGEAFVRESARHLRDALAGIGAA
ncbi:MAG: sugar phosphate isomerase/epimerase, partial [Actinobacteria bacterium]|nr:sugar phosphate isomerase/epimerase [Actinomycetota bacterium]